MIEVPISGGELIDKLSILHVKKNKISNEDKLNLVSKEFNYLLDKSKSLFENETIKLLYDELVLVNTKLWEIEDSIRILEFNSNFGNEFIELARSVYFTNDQRFEIKNKINNLISSDIMEVKEYVEYKQTKSK
jgi:hypothetical protein